MFKTGTKFLFGLAAFGLVAAALFAFATGGHKFGMDSLIGPASLGWKGYVGDHVGYAIFVGLGVAALFGGIALAVLEDGDAEIAAKARALDVVPEVPAPDRVNYWPLVGAFSLGAIALGLAVGPTLFVMGCVGLGATTIEWAVRAWSDRATGDPEVNAAIRGRLMHPIEIPAGAVLVIAFVVFCMSRVLLALPGEGSLAPTKIVFFLAPAAVLGIGVLIAKGPKLSSSAIAVILLVVGLGVLAGGIVGGISGKYEHEEHEKNEKTGAGEHGLAPLPAPGQTVIRVAG